MVALPGSRGESKVRLRLVTETAALPRDSAWFWGVCTLLTLLLALPVLFAWLHTPQGYTYTGFFAGRDDYYSYLEKMREGWSGAWLFTNRYTLEPHRPAFIFSFYLLLGHICRWLRLPLWAGYHLARLALFPATLYAVWTFLGTQVRSAGQRRWALLLAFGASGFGVLGTEGSMLTRMELRLGEHLYLADFYPHYLVDGITLIWAVLLCLRYLDDPRPRWLGLGALCLWVLALIHPFMVLPALAVPGAYALLRRRARLGRALQWGVLQALAVAPLMAYMALTLYGDPGLADWRAQAVAIPFPPRLQLLWFGLAGPLALFGAWVAWHSGRDSAVLAVAWLAVDLLLVNSRLVDNSLEFALFLGAPVAALASYTLEPLRLSLRRPLPSALVKAALLLGLGFSCLVMQVSALASPFLAGSEVQNKFYLSPGLRGAYDYIAAHSGPRTVSFSSFTAANQLVAYSPGKVYMGHAVETLDFARKYKTAEAFYTGGMDSATARHFLDAQGVEFVLEDRYSLYDMRTAGAPWTAGLSRYSFLQPVYTSSDATVYRVAG